MRPSNPAPSLLRWPLMGLAALLLVSMAVVVLAWSGTPAGAQDGGLQVSITANPANPPVNEPTMLTATITNPPLEGKPAYDWQIDFGDGNWFSVGSNSTLRYLAGEGETLGFRVTVSYGSGETATSEPVHVTWVKAGEEPTPEPTEEPTPTPEPTPEPTPVPTEEPPEPPPAPAGLTATGGDTVIELGWIDPTDGAITKYQVRVSADGGATWNPDWTDTPGSGAATTSHTLTGLTSDTEYTIELRAVRGAASAGPAASATATATPRPEPPPAPASLTATGRDAAIDLRWTDPSDSAISRYQVRVSADGGAAWDPDWTDISGSGATTTSHTLTGLTNDTEYTIELRAVRGASSAGPAASARATPSEPAPAEEPTPTPEPTPSAQDGYEPDQDLIDDVWEYAKETDEGHVHVLRWMRVLKTLGAVADMTAAEAQEHADTYWNVRWDPVVAELLNLESAPGDYEPDPAVTAEVRRYAEETGSGFDHVLRWIRVLKTFGAIEDMTAAEAQGYAEQHSAERWDPVVAELEKLEAASPPNRAPVVNTQAANYAGLGDNKVVNYAGFIGNNHAPRGVMVWKKMEGIFTDPDGDELTYTVSFTSDRSELVNWVKFSEATQRVWIEMDGDMSWKSVRPELPNPLITTVTLTATDPEGLSASVSGNFSTRWGIYPEVVSAVASAQAIELTFDLAVEADPAPGPEQFTVHVVNADGSAGTVAVSSVAVNGAVVTLELATALEEGQTVTLDYYYGYQGGTPLQQAGGGDYARNFSGQPVAWSSLEPPGQPANFAVSATAGSLDLSATWDALEGATSYRLRWRPAGGEFEAGNETTVTNTDATITVSGYGQWEVRLQACNDSGCGSEVSETVEIALPAIPFSLAPALDTDGKVRPRTLTATWDSMPGATSYTLDWRRVGADARTQAQAQPEGARQTRGASGPSGDGGQEANSQEENQLTVPGDRTSAEFTVPNDGRWNVELRGNGDNGVVGQMENEMEVKSYRPGHLFIWDWYECYHGKSTPIHQSAIRRIEADPIDGGLKVRWHADNEPVTKYQYLIQYQHYGQGSFGFTLPGADSEANWQDIPGGDVASHTFTGLENGKTYAILLRAVTGSRNCLEWVVFVTPSDPTIGPPTGLSAAVLTDPRGVIELTWDDPGDSSLSYDIQYRGHSFPSSWTPISPVSPPMASGAKFSATLPGLTQWTRYVGRPYQFRIRARRGSAIGPYSAVTEYISTGLWGTDGDDTLTDGDHAYSLFGRGGNDRLIGKGGKDRLYGHDGNDTLDGGPGADRLDGGPGTDSAYYSGPHGSVTVNVADDGTITVNGGEAQGDTLISIENVAGPAIAAFVTGNGADNILWGGAEADTLDGRGGSDTADYSRSDAGVTVDLGSTGAQSGGHAQGDTLINIENVTGSAHQDMLTGDALDNILKGGAGDDTLTGKAGNDILKGGDGIDTLDGGAGDDTLNGGEGADALDGGDGTDTADYAGASGAVTVYLATPANNTGDARGDTYTSIEIISGSAYHDRLIGDASDNVLKGSSGDDRLYGRAGNDTLDGGWSYDRLYGGPGDDTLTGGGGRDIFYFRTDLFGNDTITDYRPGDDEIIVCAQRPHNGLRREHADSGPDHVITFMVYRVGTVGTITLKGINSSSPNFYVEIHTAVSSTCSN